MMKRNILVGMIAGVALGSLSSITAMTVLNVKGNNSADDLDSITKPIRIAEYYDLNNNGKFDCYRLFERDSEGKECVVSLNWNSFMLPENTRSIDLYSMFGGEKLVEHEFSREMLENYRRAVGFPDVDEIRFFEKENW